MKNAYYLFLCGYKEIENEYTGILKKFKMQCAEFSKYYNIQFIPVYETKHNSPVYKFTRRLIWNSADRNYDEILDQMDNPLFIYIRRTTADKKLIAFLRSIKERWPNCKTIVEFYTYPYEKDEYKSLPGKLSMIKDRVYRTKYNRYVDRIVTYTKDSEIFGVKTITSLNGVDTNTFFAITARPEDHEVHLLAVAMFQKHHGYERIIEGMHRYYSSGGNRVVKLLLVGDGPEIGLYQELVEKYDLSRNVKFYGRLQGEPLNELYNSADIGLGTFGFYKIGLNSASSLKTKEYLAKGLPVAAGCVEDFVQDNDRKYYIDFPNDDTPVDIEKLIVFHDGIYKQSSSRQEIANSIHKYAEQTVSMEIALQPIIKYIGN